MPEVKFIFCIHAFTFSLNTKHLLPACQNHLGSLLKIQVPRTLPDGLPSSECGEGPGLGPPAPRSMLGSVGRSPFQHPALQVLVFLSWKAPPHLQDSYSSSEARFKHSPFFFEAWLCSATQDD